MIYVQLIGLLAFCILVLSFYRKEVITILLYQITANAIYFVHYFLLGALTGAFINVINIIRNAVFIKTKNKILVPIFIILYLAVTLVFYENIYSFIPFIASASYLIFMPLNKKKYLLIGEIISATLWLLYSLFVNSYSGMVTESILIVSNTFQLIKLNRSK